MTMAPYCIHDHEEISCCRTRKPISPFLIDRMLKILAINPRRIKKRTGGFLERNTVCGLIGRRPLLIPFEHLLCIYERWAACKIAGGVGSIRCSALAYTRTDA
jgi:hypothetical protein